MPDLVYRWLRGTPALSIATVTVGEHTYDVLEAYSVGSGSYDVRRVLMGQGDRQTTLDTHRVVVPHGPVGPLPHCETCLSDTCERLALVLALRKDRRLS